MTDPTTTFLKRLKDVGFSTNERLALRERLSLYASMHPALATETGSVPSFFTFIASRRFSAYAISLTALIVLGGSVTFAAEGSVPGDALYAVKIDVNEPMMTALAPTSTGQAQVAAAIATRRVDEAVTLATRGTLTPERQAYLAAQFNTKVAIANQKTGALAQRNPSAAVAVNDEFAANLAGEAEALGAASESHAGQGNDLLDTVVATSQDLSETADSGDTSVLVSTTASGSGSATTTTTDLNATSTEDATAAAALESGSSTPNAFSTHRLSRYLRITASTTLRVSPASATPFDGENPPVPALDISIPHIGAPTTPDDAGASEGGSLETNLNQ